MNLQFKLRRGLDIPLSGAPEQRIYDAPPVATVGLVGLDYLGLRPVIEVEPGQRVRLGQSLFSHRRIPGLRFVAPGSGEVAAVNRGSRRALQSVLIRLDAEEGSAQLFPALGASGLAGLERALATERLLESGLWTALRTRPYSRIPVPGTQPQAIFVTAMDTNPLAADPAVIIAEQPEAFAAGLDVLTCLTAGKVFLCQAPGDDLPHSGNAQIVTARFSGPHPAGLAGTHMHFLAPVDAQHVAWSIGYQDVIAFGKLFAEGVLWIERIVALGGPVVARPRLLRTRLGACIDDLINGELPHGVECRVISGSPLSGRRASAWASYLGRYHHQVCVLAEGRERELFGWIRPGFNKFSATRIFLSSLLHRGRRFPLNTSQNGSPRAMVPIGTYEAMMPQDILPTQLLRALVVRDTDLAQKLGCMELDEEDLALCSFVCPGKYDYGPALRASLELIEKEG